MADDDPMTAKLAELPCRSQGATTLPQDGNRRPGPGLDLNPTTNTAALPYSIRRWLCKDTSHLSPPTSPVLLPSPNLDCISLSRKSAAGQDTSQMTCQANGITVSLTPDEAALQLSGIGASFPDTL